jgi:hypothetical protein
MIAPGRGLNDAPGAELSEARSRASSGMRRAWLGIPSERVSIKYLNSVTPAKAGVQKTLKNLDSGFRRNDVK